MTFLLIYSQQPTGASYRIQTNKCGKTKLTTLQWSMSGTTSNPLCFHSTACVEKMRGKKRRKEKKGGEQRGKSWKSAPESCKMINYSFFQMLSISFSVLDDNRIITSSELLWIVSLMTHGLGLSLTQSLIIFSYPLLNVFSFALLICTIHSTYQIVWFCSWMFNNSMKG